MRSGEASSEEFFELGAVMLRKKYYVLANKYLEQAIKKWDGDEADLAQVSHGYTRSLLKDTNYLSFCVSSLGSVYILWDCRKAFAPSLHRIYFQRGRETTT